MAQEAVSKGHGICWLDCTHGTLILPWEQHQIWVLANELLDSCSITKVSKVDLHLRKSTRALEALIQSVTMIDFGGSTTHCSQLVGPSGEVSSYKLTSSRTQGTVSLFFSMKERPHDLVLVGSCIPHA